MSRQQTVGFVTLAVLTLLAAATAPAFPVEPLAVAVQQAAVEAAAPDAEAEPAEPAPPAAAEVERILQEQEQMLQGRGFAYDPEDRRDPFRSLYDVVKRKEGPRPPGIGGMGVDEIDLTGIVEDTDGGYLAYFTGSDNKGYFLRVGDRVFDGTLIAIEAREGAVTFRQQVDDPRQIKPYRDVVRRLVPLDEEKGE
jgi:hypothetical protein